MRARAEAITRLCFAAEPSERDLGLLGDRERWLLYRSMVRSRLRKVVQSAFEGSRKAMGPEAFTGLFEAWLDQEAPRTRYFWQVPLGFGAWALPQLPEAPAHLTELFRFELIRWRVRHQEVPASPSLVELSFERPPALNPTVELLSLRFPVHAPDSIDPENPAETLLCVYRDHRHRAATLSLNPMAYALVEEWRRSDQPLTESVHAVTRARGTAIDQGFVEKLGALLADFLERGILLGSQAG